MSDYLDYENNLAFDPTSADDLNEQGRKSDVLVSALEKCEKLEKHLEIAVVGLEVYAKEPEGYRDAVRALEQIEELDK